MPSPLGQQDDERLQIQKCQEGDTEALGWLRNKLHPALVGILVARGASATETEDLLADLWGDCVARSDDRPSLLEKFSGKCPLRNWLATVATRRWIDWKRKSVNRREAASHRADDPDEDIFERMPAAASSATEGGLIDLLRDSLQAAFDQCSAADLLMLRLVYLQRLSQREVCRMWGWNEAKVSRRLSDAMERIEIETLRRLRQKDPWLQLTWEDFVDMCETHQIGFL